MPERKSLLPCEVWAVVKGHAQVLDATAIFELFDEREDAEEAANDVCWGNPRVVRVQILEADHAE